MSAEDREREERVGRLLIRHGAGDVEVAIERVVDVPVGRALPGPATALMAILSTLLLSFAGYVRSWPAIGTVSFAILALAWLVLRSGRGRATGKEEVEVHDRRLVVRGPLATLDVALDEVDSFGIGRDAMSERTLWVRLAARERVLILDALTDAEASACLGAMDAALDASASRA